MQDLTVDLFRNNQEFNLNTGNEGNREGHFRLTHPFATQNDNSL